MKGRIRAVQGLDGSDLWRPVMVFDDSFKTSDEAIAAAENELREGRKVIQVIEELSQTVSPELLK